MEGVALPQADPEEERHRDVVGVTVGQSEAQALAVAHVLTDADADAQPLAVGDREDDAHTVAVPHTLLDREEDVQWDAEGLGEGLTEGERDAVAHVVEHAVVLAVDDLLGLPLDDPHSVALTVSEGEFVPEEQPDADTVTVPEPVDDTHKDADGLPQALRDAVSVPVAQIVLDTVPLGEDDLLVYIKQLNLRTRISASQFSFNELPGVDIAASIFAYYNYTI
jgi:hypothetical protein